MTLVPAKCPNCGGNITIEKDDRAGICEYCKQPFVTEDAITNYNTYVQQTYSIENADVYIHDEHSIDQKINNAEVFFSKFEDYEKARDIFTTVANEAPERYEGWFGLCRVITNDFSNTNIDHDSYKEATRCVQHAVVIADESTKELIKGKWNSYSNSVQSVIDENLDTIHEIENREKKASPLKEEIDNNNKTIRDLREEVRVSESTKDINNGVFEEWGFLIGSGLAGGCFVIWIIIKILGGGNTFLWIALIGIVIAILGSIATKATNKRDTTINGLKGERCKKLEQENEVKLEEIKSFGLSELRRSIGISDYASITDEEDRFIRFKSDIKTL